MNYLPTLGLDLAQTPLGSAPPNSFTLTTASDNLGWKDMHAAVIDEGAGSRTHRGKPVLWLWAQYSDIDVSYIVDGSETRMIVPTHRVAILGPNTPIEVDLRSQSVRTLHIAIKSELLGEVANELFNIPLCLEIDPVFGAEDPSILHKLQAVMHALGEPMQHGALQIGYLARALTAGVLAKHAKLRHRPLIVDTTSNLTKNQLQRVTEYIEENLSSNLSLDELAAIAGLSRTAFIQRFKQSFQQTPHQYLVSARVRRSRDQLAKSDLPITHIAAACGFFDHAHFSSVFKRAIGITPSAYRLKSR